MASQSESAGPCALAITRAPSQAASISSVRWVGTEKPASSA